MRVPLYIPLELAKQTPLCIHCKYYIPPPPRAGTKAPGNKKDGFCQKSGKINVVDGEIKYQLVEITREYECQGNWYDPIHHPATDAVDSMDYPSY